MSILKHNIRGGGSMDVDGKMEAARISVAVTGVTLYGFTLNEWVAIFTIIYLVSQICVLLPKAFRTVHAIYRKIHMWFTHEKSKSKNKGRK